MLALLILAPLLAPGCRQQAPDKTPEPPTEAPAANPPEPRAVSPAIAALTRADIVSAAAQAASVFAEGSSSTAPNALVGRSFTVRIPFGCTGPAAPDTAEPRNGLADWSASEDGKSIRLRLEPADWTSAALFTAPQAAAKWEAVDGFWIPRPWLASETCPKVAADPEAAAAPQSVGLAAVFERGGSRLGQRDGRAYSFVLRSDTDEVPVERPQHLTLVLAGRITAFGDGRAFACTASGPDQRPVCVAAVQLDRVAFEGDGRTLAEWQPG